MFAKTGPWTKRNERRPVAWSSSMMSVPVMSLGMRSGVNWMRLNLRSSTRARLEMSRVLASPGTPTSSTWPLANRAVSSCSTTRSWPTMTLCSSARIFSRAAFRRSTACRSEPAASGLTHTSWGSGRRQGAEHPPKAGPARPESNGGESLARAANERQSLDEGLTKTRARPLLNGAAGRRARPTRSAPASSAGSRSRRARSRGRERPRGRSRRGRPRRRRRRRPARPRAAGAPRGRRW